MRTEKSKGVSFGGGLRGWYAAVRAFSLLICLSFFTTFLASSSSPSTPSSFSSSTHCSSRQPCPFLLHFVPSSWPGGGGSVFIIKDRN